MPTTDYLPMFGPAQCRCGNTPDVVEMPNEDFCHRWQVICAARKTNRDVVCRNDDGAFGATMEIAIRVYNERAGYVI